MPRATKPRLYSPSAITVGRDVAGGQAGLGPELAGAEHLVGDVGGHGPGGSMEVQAGTVAELDIAEGLDIGGESFLAEAIDANGGGGLGSEETRAFDAG